MGSKLFAAFGAGALLAAAGFYMASKPKPAAPLTIPPVDVATSQTVESPVVKAPEAAVTKPPVVPPAPPAKRIVRKTFRPVVLTLAAPPPSSTSIDADLPVLNTPVEEPSTISASAEFPPLTPQTVTLSAGTLIQIRLGERLATDRNLEGDAFSATLDHELVADGWVIAEAGARVLGRIVQLDQAGRVQGTASMTLELTSITISDGQRVFLHTANFLRKGDTTKKSDVTKVALGSAIGAAIGAAAGGGKGAAIGAGAGGAAGVGTVLATRGKPAVLEIETRLSFRLDNPVTITEQRSN